jgi:hypothetical protein
VLGLAGDHLKTCFFLGIMRLVLVVFVAADTGERRVPVFNPKTSLSDEAFFSKAFSC